MQIECSEAPLPGYDSLQPNKTSALMASAAIPGQVFVALADAAPPERKGSVADDLLVITSRLRGSGFEILTLLEVRPNESDTIHSSDGIDSRMEPSLFRRV